MLQSIAVVTVAVSNQKKALKFYTKTLGFKVRLHMKEINWVEVAPGEEGTSLSLVQPDPKWGKEMHDELKKHIGEETGVIFRTNDIKGDHNRLRKKGVIFTQAPRKEDWGGSIAGFKDPDGNKFSMVQVPEGM